MEHYELFAESFMREIYFEQQAQACEALGQLDKAKFFRQQVAGEETLRESIRRRSA